MTQDKGAVTYGIDGPIATITLSRPGKRNSMTQGMFDQLAAVVGEAEGSKAMRVLVIRGDGGTFCAGDDLSELVATHPTQIREFLLGVQRTFTRLEALPVPVVAAVEGFAAGGGLELALSCDLIMAAGDAKLGLPEVNLAIIPGLGGTIRLPRRVGLGRAREMVYSGKLVDAVDAHGMGLVDGIFPAGEFDKGVTEYVEKLASKSPVALSLAKSTINRGMDASLEAGLALEREAFAYCFALPDAKEGISAFLEKRKPKFK
jgi:enoyl-CoA hydratase/carnithine racemase